jgi:hypothetical protein
VKALVVEGPGTYYLGIIDILQQWDYRKRIERFLKIYGQCVDGEGLSAIDPERYAMRFWQRAVLDTFEGTDFSDEDLFRELPSDQQQQQTDKVDTMPLTTASLTSHSSFSRQTTPTNDERSIVGENGSAHHRGNAMLLT